MTLDWIVQHKDLAEALSYWATAFGIVAAVFAGAWVIWKHFQDRQQQLMFRARELYDSYIKLSMDYPEYFIKYWDRKNITNLDRERYVGFVAYMLNGLEDILMVSNTPEWRESLKADLRYHKLYFRSSYFAELKKCYFGEMQRLLDQVISEPDLEVSYA